MATVWTISSRGAVQRERFAAALLGEGIQGAGAEAGSGKRAYTAQDIEIVGVLHDLLKGKGTIDGAKRQLKQALKEQRQTEALRQRLEAIRGSWSAWRTTWSAPPGERTRSCNEIANVFGDPILEGGHGPVVSMLLSLVRSASVKYW